MSDDDFPLTPGYRLNAATVLRDLHRLLSAFLAYSPIRALANGESDPLSMLQERFTEDEIVHQLVSTAIMNRLHMEHMHRLREDPDELSFKPVEATCGELYPDAGKDEKTGLDFREACNKIIHAQSVEIFDPDKPVLRLRGKLGRKEWMAFVEVIDYVRASVTNFEDALA
jgi:hypothetical protein